MQIENEIQSPIKSYDSWKNENEKENMFMNDTTRLEGKINE